MEESIARGLRDNPQLETLRRGIKFGWPSKVTPKFESQRHEQFLVFLLDGQNKLLAERIISEGIPTQSVVYTRKVMEEALRLSASAVVVVHNHPSGEVTPSPQDIETTQKMKQAAEVLEIILQDHIIIGRECYYSFMENGKILD
jgi:DNA repair protein RadC